MRPDRASQLARAAALAGRKVVDDPKARAEGIVERIAPAIAAAIAAEMALVRSARQDAYEAEKALACRVVGDALDTLDQARFAGGPEYRARIGLEHAVRKLKRVLDREGRADG